MGCVKAISRRIFGITDLPLLSRIAIPYHPTPMASNPKDDMAPATKADVQKILQRFDQVDSKFDDIDKRFDQADKRFGEADDTFKTIEHQFQVVLATITAMEKSLKEEIRKAKEEMQQDLYEQTTEIYSRANIMEKTIANHEGRIEALEKGKLVAVAA